MNERVAPIAQATDTLAVAQHGDGTALRLSGYARVPEPEVEPLWLVYLRAFGALATRAASRHLMDHDQFCTEMADPRITKFVVFQGAAPVGLLTITTDLDGIVWVSPDFYRDRYPTKARQGRVFFVTNMLTDPECRGQEAFLMLTEAACRVAAGGVLGFDVCEFNVQRGFPEAVRRRVSQLHGGACTFQELDSQRFYGIDLAGPLLPR